MRFYLIILILGLASLNTACTKLGGKTSVIKSNTKKNTSLPASTPSQPISLAATSLPTSVNLTWSHPGGAGVTYKIFRGLSSTTFSELASGVSFKSYVDTSTITGTHYYYYVLAFNGKESLPSSIVEAMPMGSFSILSATSISKKQVDLSWTKANGADTYEVYYGLSAGACSNKIEGLSLDSTGVNVTTSISSLLSNTTYYFLVKAKNSIIPSDALNSSNEMSAKTFVNNAPVISSISTQRIASDSTLTLHFKVTDVDDEFNCIDLNATSSGLSTFSPSESITFLQGYEPYCRAQIRPSEIDEGTVHLTFTAQDNEAYSVPIDFDLTIPCKVSKIEWLSDSNLPLSSIPASDQPNLVTTPAFAMFKKNGQKCLTNDDPVSLELYYKTDRDQKDGEIFHTPQAVTPISNGIVTFTDSTIKRAGTYSLYARQGSVASSMSPFFDVTPLSATKVSWRHPPISSSLNSVIPAASVQITDNLGNFVKKPYYPINLNVLNPTDVDFATSSTTSEITGLDGYASFSNLIFALPAGASSLTNDFVIKKIIASNGTFGSDTSPKFLIFNDPIPTVNAVTSTIEMLQGPITITNLPAAQHLLFPRSRFPMGTRHYDGELTYRWSIVATNNSGDNISVLLVNGEKSKDIQIQPNDGQIVYKEIEIDGATFDSSDANWTLAIKGENTTVFSSRLTIIQKNATRTQVYIPLSSIESTNMNGFIKSSSTTFTVPNRLNFHPYFWNNTEIDRIDSTALVATLSSSEEGVESCVALFKKASSLQIGPSACTTSTIPEQFFLTSIEPSDLQFQEEIEIRVSTADSDHPARFYKAGLLVRLLKINKTIAFQTIKGAQYGITSESDSIFHYGKMLNKTEFAGDISQERSIVCYGDTENNESMATFDLNTMKPDSGAISGPLFVSSPFNFFESKITQNLFNGEELNQIPPEGDLNFLSYQQDKKVSQILSECHFVVKVIYHESP
jgi:hypothetical protein